MTDPREEVGARLQTDRPHSARVWNYLLGGKDNYPVDSEAGDVILTTFPEFAAV
ncbi:SAM-dependent methyltransferase, partial [Streptomyces sp. SID5926]|nr:SAM-dependent methyltransferase [Streptomyces sp. SID5926]